MGVLRAFKAAVWAVPAAVLVACGSDGSVAGTTNAAATTSAATTTTATTSAGGAAAPAATGTASLSISNSPSTIQFAVAYQGTPTYVHVFIDTDRKTTTGYPVAGIGADYMLENGNVFRYAGSAGSWTWTLVGTTPFSEAGGVANWAVALSSLGSPSAINAVGNYSTVYSPLVTHAMAGRNAMTWPFSSGSVWNTPIGSGASFAASGLSFTTTPDSTEYWYDMPLSDHERIVLEPSAPMTPVYINTAGWSGGNRCAQQGELFFEAPIPADYVVPNSTLNNGVAILLSDGATIVQTEPFTRCPGYSYGTSMKVPLSLSAWEYNIKTGDGRLGAHGGSGLSTLGGTIRLGELRPGTQMRHALKILVDSATSLGRCTGNFAACFKWPAATADTYAANSSNGYGSATGNTNTAMKMGSLLAIPSSVNINAIGLRSVPGQLLAWTMQNYGAYIVDTAGGPGLDIAVEDGSAGSKVAEFQSDYGYPFDGRLGYLTLKTSSGAATPQAEWVADVRIIIENLRVVVNNSASAVGGGGTPRQPLPPAFE